LAILYTTGCPKCKILKQKLDEKNITYEVCSDVKVMMEKGMRSVPMLEVNNKIINYEESLNWIKEQ
jgi:glutaredoxin